MSVGLLVSDVGLQVAGTRAIAANRERSAEYVTALLLLGAAFAVTSYVVTAGAALTGLLPEGVNAGVAIFGIVLLLAPGINAYWSLLRGFERQGIVYLAYSVSSIALLGAVAAAGVSGAGLETILALYVGSFGLRLLLTLALVKAKMGWPRWRLDALVLKGLLAAAPAVALAYILQGIYSHVDVVLLGFLVSAADVGSYAAAYRLVDAGTFLTAGALNAAIFPVLSRLAREAREDIPELYNRVSRLLAAFLAPGVLVLAGLAGPITDTVYGGGLEDVDWLFTLLAPAILLIALNFTTTFLLLAIGMTRGAILATGVAAAVNIAGNLVGVPLFGVVAAAGATLVAEVVMLGLFHVTLRSAGFPSTVLQTGTIAALLVAFPLSLAVALPEARTAVALLGAGGALVAVRLASLLRSGDIAGLRRAMGL